MQRSKQSVGANNCRERGLTNCELSLTPTAASAGVKTICWGKQLPQTRAVLTGSYCRKRRLSHWLLVPITAASCLIGWCPLVATSTRKYANQCCASYPTERPLPLGQLNAHFCFATERPLPLGQRGGFAIAVTPMHCHLFARLESSR